MGRAPRTSPAPRPIVARLPAAASHPRRPAASPPGPPQAAAGHPRGLPSPDPGGPGHDPGRGRRRPRAVRDGAGHRGHPPAQAGPPRAIRPGRPGGPGPPAHAPPVAPAAAGRRRFLAVLGDALVRDGFIPLGGDGSRQECPRNDELLARMGRAGKAGAAPSLRVTALVHPGTGAPGSRRLGRGDAGERDRLRRLPATPPELAPVVADAGHHGHDPAAAMLGAGASFLIRMPSSVRLFVDRPVDPGRFDQGPVTYWPLEARQKGWPPLRLRLIRVRPRREARGGRRRADVRLLTDVLSPRRLSAERAGRLYRRRRENEGLSRTCKRTPAKVHLAGRSVRGPPRGLRLVARLPAAPGAGGVGVGAGPGDDRDGRRVQRAGPRWRSAAGRRPGGPSTADRPSGDGWRGAAATGGRGPATSGSANGRDGRRIGPRGRRRRSR